MAAYDSVSITGTGGPHAPSPGHRAARASPNSFRAWIDTLWDLPASAPEWPDDVVMPDKMHVVAIEMFGKCRVDAAINSRNLVQRFKTTVNIEFSDFVAVFEALGDEARSLHAAVESEGSQSTSAGYRRSHRRRRQAPIVGTGSGPTRRPQRTEQRPRGAKTVRYSGDRTEQPTSPSRFAARTGRECSACRRPHRASGRSGRSPRRATHSS